MSIPLLPHSSAQHALDASTDDIRSSVTELGELTEQAITRAMWGLVARDVDLCAAVVEDDARLNDLRRDIGELCIERLARSPDLGRVREIVGFLQIATELERIGDHCVSIARIARTLSGLPELRPYVDLPKLAEYCCEQVRDILDALVARDVARARAVAARDDRIDRIYHRLFDDLVQLMTEEGASVFRATNLAFVAHHLERVADRVTNIAEDIVFLETGRIEELG